MNAAAARPLRVVAVGRPLRVLVLGGSQFIGRHVVEALLAAGHRVSIFNRGRSPDALPAAVERLRGDRDRGADGLRALAGRQWDACIDVSGYTPRQLQPSTELLAAHIGRYVLISAVMVYAHPMQRPVAETQARQAPAPEHVTEVVGAAYGQLKVACEDLVGQVYGERATVLRPQIVIGPHDPSGRYAYWIQRAAQGGTMLAPGDGSDHLQVIDVRDLARFVVTVVERDLDGAFNLAGPRLRWSQFIEMLGVGQPAWVPADVLQAAGLSFVDLPIYRHDSEPRASLMDVSNAKACAAGLQLRSPEASLRDMQAWLRESPQAWCRQPPAVIDPDADPLPGLSPQREAELIARAR